MKEYFFKFCYGFHLLNYDGPAFVLQNFNIYKRLAYSIFSMPGKAGPESYKLWADLRNMLADVVSSFYLQIIPYCRSL